MPKYDYQCEECVEIFEEEHSMTHSGPVECPICGTSLTHKIILRTPGIYVYWKDAASSSEAGLPKYLRPVEKERRDRRKAWQQRPNL